MCGTVDDVWSIVHYKQKFTCSRECSGAKGNNRVCGYVAVVSVSAKAHCVAHFSVPADLTSVGNFVEARTNVTFNFHPLF